MSSDNTELYYAHMEADRNEATDAYFKARPGFGELEKSIFRAGFERAYAKLWPLAGAPAATQETSSARCTCNDFPGADQFCTAHNAQAVCDRAAHLADVPTALTTETRTDEVQR